VQRCRAWWATARSSVITHRAMKWGWIILTVAAVSLGWIYSVAFVSVLSLVALILGSWSAEEAAVAAMKQESDSS
jgi:hypothetical protein